MKLNGTLSQAIRPLALSVMLLAAGPALAVKSTPAEASPTVSQMTTVGASVESQTTPATAPADMAVKTGSPSETPNSALSPAAAPAIVGDPAGVKTDAMGNATEKNDPASSTTTTTTSTSAQTVTEGPAGGTGAAAPGDSNTKKLFDYLQHGHPQAQAGTEPPATASPVAPENKTP